MITRVLLDGDYVDAALINPKEHVFLGMFRPAINPMANPTTDILCSCDQILRYRGQEHEHYLKGCFDVPQYATAATKQISNKGTPSAYDDGTVKKEK